MPIFAKLLSLSSLQGMADLLTGEGIRFTDFEMNFSNDGKLMTINEIYAIGPAISILMDGYVEKNKLISDKFYSESMLLGRLLLYKPLSVLR